MTAGRARTLRRRWTGMALVCFALACWLDVSPLDNYFAISALSGAAICYAHRAHWTGWLARDEAQAKIDAIDKAEKACRASR